MTFPEVKRSRRSTRFLFLEVNQSAMPDHHVADLEVLGSRPGFAVDQTCYLGCGDSRFSNSR